MKGLQAVIACAEQYLANKQPARASALLIDYSKSDVEVLHLAPRETLYHFHLTLVFALKSNNAIERVRKLWKATHQCISCTQLQPEDKPIVEMVYAFHEQCYSTLSSIEDTHEAARQFGIASGLAQALDVAVFFVARATPVDAFCMWNSYLINCNPNAEMFCNVIARMMKLESDNIEFAENTAVYEALFGYMALRREWCFFMPEMRQWYFEACLRTKNFAALSWFPKDDDEVTVVAGILMKEPGMWRRLTKLKTSRRMTKMRMCFHCGRFHMKLKRCAKCLLLFFCNEQCNQEGWPEHKRVCAKVMEARNAPPKEI